MSWAKTLLAAAMGLAQPAAAQMLHPPLPYEGLWVETTPYDDYLDPVKKILGDAQEPHGASMQKVRELMAEAHAFRYEFTDPYVARVPSLVSRTKKGDCKDRALWLLERLNDPGAYFVVGKLTAASKTSHAWLYWEHRNRWYILDPTCHTQPLPADNISTRYFPLYSYVGQVKYQHGRGLPQNLLDSLRGEP